MNKQTVVPSNVINWRPTAEVADALNGLEQEIETRTGGISVSRGSLLNFIVLKGIEAWRKDVNSTEQQHGATE